MNPLLVRLGAIAAVLAIAAWYWFGTGDAPPPEPDTVVIDAAEVTSPGTARLLFDDLIGTERFGLYLGTARIGSATRTHQLEAGAPTVELELETEVAKLGHTTRITMTERLEFGADAPYALVRYERSVESPSDIVTDTVTRRGGSYRQRRATAIGTEELPAIEGFEFALADQLAGDLYVRRIPETWQHLRARSLENALASAGFGTVVRVWAPFRRDGGFGLRSADAAGLEAYWDASGALARMTLGDSLALVRETGVAAAQDEPAPDVFDLARVALDVPLAARVDADRVAFSVDADSARFFAEPAPGQRLEFGIEGPRVVIDRSGYGVATDADSLAGAAQQVADLPVDDPRIQLFARRAGDGDDDSARAKAIAAFVHRLVDYQPTDRAALTTSNRVLEVLDDPRGTCDDFAALYATIASAAGLPVRMVDGLLYLGDEAGAFGMHRWNEVAVDGFWLPVDATANSALEIEPSRLRFAIDGNTRVLAELAAPTIRLRLAGSP